MARKAFSKEFCQAFTDKVLPRLVDFAPEMLFVSAGFDAHVRDPLCDQRLMTSDFAWLTRELMAVARACAVHVSERMSHKRLTRLGQPASIRCSHRRVVPRERLELPT